MILRTSCPQPSWPGVLTGRCASIAARPGSANTSWRRRFALTSPALAFKMIVVETVTPATKDVVHEAATDDARPDARPRGDAAGVGPAGVLPPQPRVPRPARRGPRRPAPRLPDAKPGGDADVVGHRRHGGGAGQRGAAGGEGHRPGGRPLGRALAEPPQGVRARGRQRHG